MPPFSAGSWFHSLHATSHALQPMETVVSVKNPMGSGISRLLHVADERLAFVDRDIGVTHPGGEIVDHISGGESHPAPVPGHADMVDEFAADAHDADTIGHERLGANVTARRADADPVEVPDPLLLAAALPDFEEQFGRELVVPGKPAAHR